MAEPNLFADMNWLGLAAAVVVNMILGMIWYNPKTPMGKVWVKQVGMDPDMKPDAKAMMMPLVMAFVGAILTMFVLAHTFSAYSMAYSTTGAKLMIMDGIMGGFFVTLGFIVPVQLSQVAWEKKSWGYAMVNISYYLVTLIIAGILLVTL